MNAELAADWLTRETLNCWDLRRGEKEKVSRFEAGAGEEYEESITRFRDISRMLAPGDYLLLGWKGKHKQAGQTSFRFEVAKVVPANILQNKTRHMQNDEYQEMLLKAKTLALAEFEEKQFKERVLKSIDDLSERVAVLEKSIAQLTDDDDDNDDDAIARLQVASEKLPGIVKGIQGMRGLFKTT
jgi:hypothetical protein